MTEPPPSLEQTESSDPNNDQAPRASRGFRVVLLGSLIGAAGCIAGIAAIRHSPEQANVFWLPIASAILITLAGCIPPLWLNSLTNNGPANQLAVVCWRLGALLPAVAATRIWEGSERNCFVAALLACYFVALPLESWLLIRDARQNDVRLSHVPTNPPR